MKSVNKFSEMPILEGVCQRAMRLDRGCFNSAAFIFTSHLLDTALTLFKSVISLGISPEQIHVLGKFYSANAVVTQKLQAAGVHVIDSTKPTTLGSFSSTFSHDIAKFWDSFFRDRKCRSYEKVIVVDDGGQCIAAIPPSAGHRWSFVGIEQTTRGLRRLQLVDQLPIIHLASSAAKRHIEPPMISEAILKKLRLHVSIDSTYKTCGVIGLGNIGKAIVKDLTQRGVRVLVFDQNSCLHEAVPKAFWCNSVEEIVTEADYVFGCTGEDVFEDAFNDTRWLRNLAGHKIFISCSSEDIEFLSVLKAIQENPSSWQSNPLSTIRYELPNATISILRGGFPINFDGSPESVPANKIQVTLGLVLGGLVQAALYNRGSRSEGNSGIMLEPAIQRFVVTSWFEQEPLRKDWYPPNTPAAFGKLDWIRNNSTGCRSDSEVIQTTFG